MQETRAARQEPKNSPLMLAWEEFQKGEDFKNSAGWAQRVELVTDETGALRLTHPHVQGAYWAMFLHGFLAAQEAAAKVAESGRFLHDDSPEARFGKECAGAIRRMRETD